MSVFRKISIISLILNLNFVPLNDFVYSIGQENGDEDPTMDTGGVVFKQIDENDELYDKYDSQEDNNSQNADGEIVFRRLEDNEYPDDENNQDFNNGDSTENLNENKANDYQITESDPVAVEGISSEMIRVIVSADDFAIIAEHENLNEDNSEKEQISGMKVSSEQNHGKIEEVKKEENLEEKENEENETVTDSVVSFIEENENNENVSSIVSFVVNEENIKTETDEENKEDVFIQKTENEENKNVIEENNKVIETNDTVDNFSSKENAESVFVSEYNGMYILQYPSLEEANAAVEYYNTYANFAVLDTVVFINQDEEITPEEEIVSETEMNSETNPFSELSNAVEELQTVEEEPEEKPSFFDNVVSFFTGDDDSEKTDEETDIKKIAVIDTGNNYSGIESISMLGDSGNDVNGHGTKMIDYILEEDPSADIIAIKALGDDGKGDISAVYAGIMYAIEAKVNTINMSFNAFSTEENAVLKDAVKKATEAGIIVVSSAGNNNLDAKYFTPSNIDEAIVIGSAVETEEKVTKQGFSNYGETVDYYVLSDSTSEGAARFSGLLSEIGQEEVNNSLNTSKVFLLDENYEFVSGNVEEMDQSGEFQTTASSGTYGCPWSLDDNGVLTIGTDGGNCTLTSTTNASSSSWPWYNNRSVKKAVIKGTVKSSSGLYGMFYGLTNMTEIDGLTNLDTSAATTMESMFEGCTNLTSLDVSSFNTSAVTNMRSMFNSCFILTSLNLSSFNTSAVTDMGNMFNNCRGLTSLNLSSFNTSVVVDMSNMFYGCNSIMSLDLSSFNTSAVLDMINMFYGCNSIMSLDLSSFNTSAVLFMNNMFCNCFSLLSVKLGSDFSFKRALLPTPSSVAPNNGKWELKDNMDMAKQYTSEQMRDTDPQATAPGEYVWAADHPPVFDTGQNVNTAFKQLSGQSSATYNTSNTTITSIQRSNVAPAGVTTVDISENQDGSIVAWADGTTVYVYSEYPTIKLNSSCTHMFYNFQSLETISLSLSSDDFDTSSAIDMDHIFDNCKSLETITGINSWDVSNITTMNSMFYNCEELESINISDWVTTSLTDTAHMFDKCKTLTTAGNLNNLNVSNVTNMAGMFQECQALTSLGTSGVTSWDTGNVTDMAYMFYKCHALTTPGDLENWDVSNVTSFRSTFDECSALTSVGNLHKWQTGDVTNMAFMFNDCGNLTYIGNISANSALGYWDVSNVTTMESMFNECEKLGSTNNGSIGDLSDWETTSLTNTDNMFLNCKSLTDTGDLDDWDMSDVTHMHNMFDGCIELTNIGDLSGWDTSSAQYMNGVFQNCQKLTSIGNLNNWSTGNVLQMDYMFNHCLLLTAIGNISSWDVSKVTTMESMFNNCVVLGTTSNGTIGNLSGWRPSSVTSTAYMFLNCRSLTSIGNLDNWTVGNLRNSYNMFDSCTSLTTIGNLRNWNTQNLEYASSMFLNCTSLISLDLSNWDIRQLKSTSYMFENCSSLESLSLKTNPASADKTVSLLEMKHMFKGLTSLQTLDVSSFDTSNVTDMERLFNGSTGLTSITGLTSFDTSNVTDMSYMFGNDQNNVEMGLTSLNLSSFDTSSATDMTGMFRQTKNITSITLPTTFSFEGDSISDTSKQALLDTPNPQSSRWQLRGNTNYAKQYTSSQMRGSEPQETEPGEYIWTFLFYLHANNNTGAITPYSTESIVNNRVPDPQFVAPTGFSFKGWATSQSNADAGIIAYTTNSNFAPQEETNLYATWEKPIYFYSGINENTTTIVSQYYNGPNEGAGTGLNITTPDSATCADISGWAELGWRDDTTAGAKEIDFNVSITPASTSYYAVYSRDLTLSYNGNGNTGGSAPANGTFTQKYNTNGAITSPAFTLANNTFTKTRYIFNDWDLGTPSSVYTVWNPAVSDTTVTKTAYAQWLRQNNVSVICQVSGNMGSKDKLFTYTVAFTNTDTPYENRTINYTLNGSARTLTLDSSAQGTIELSSNDTATFQEILEGTTFTVTQQNYAADGYNVNHLSVTETLSNTDYNVTFTNENAVAVPTGINKQNSLAVSIIFLIGILGIFCIGIKKSLRKREI